MKRYRCKPVEIEAIEWGGQMEADLRKFLIGTHSWRDGILSIQTLEGWVDCPPGHFIIRGLMGEFYPCHPVAFHEKYEAVE